MKRATILTGQYYETKARNRNHGRPHSRNGVCLNGCQPDRHAEKSAIEMAVTKTYHGIAIPVFPIELLVAAKYLAGLPRRNRK